MDRLQLQGESSVPDELLLQQARLGSLDAFEALVNRYERPVFNLVYRIVRNEHDAEDITQQAFLAVAEHLPELRNETAFRPWLFRIATNLALKVLRHRQKEVFDSLGPSEQADGEGGQIVPRPVLIADWRYSPDQILSRKELREQIESALDKLELAYRVVFLLRDVEGLSVRETAEILGLSEANVKVRLLRARLKLRELLTEMFEERATRVRENFHKHAGTKGPIPAL